ncbi:HlyD family type I secretion periplasmic adaptor subunit [Hydrogenophaga electricum]|uniref:Membrane fusion protein (MFP) family protein n=1 Tax=Hydrogenophaga electricum TaxID=1230953 RepID=A0ABQ6C847_9BURK|nr:HlyD family type I secretion periplasmic adaptor subunit [Hydrogenophaga electricum]GLS14496.1 HlyD family type I secretion periplasmic adaptor subunit [Hydrogenophaga electricum]
MTDRHQQGDRPDILAAPAAPGGPDTRARDAWSLPRKLLWGGVIALALIGLGYPVETVVTAPGRVIPSDRVKSVQHLEGGIVSAVLVKDGDRVRQGQPLVEIDLGGAGLNLEETAARFDASQAARIRLRAESQGQPLAREDFPASLDDDVVQGQLGAYGARMQEQHGQTLGASSVLEQARSREQELQAKIEGLRQRQALYEKELSISEQLLSEKLVGQIEVLQKRREYETVRGELSVARQGLVSAQAAIAEARAKQAEVAGRFRRRASDELAEVERELASLTENLNRARAQRQRTVVRAPTEGIVKGSRNPSPGWVVKPGEQIMEIVPDEEQVVVEARLSPNDRGFVYAGQPARIKVTAYDFLRYGTVDGEVTLVAADADKDASVPDSPAFYRLLLSASQFYVGNRENRVTAGMQADVDLQVGRDPFIWYLLRPVLKLQREAFQEP